MNSVDQVWNDNPEYIKKYYDLAPLQERLCEEVSYILEKKVNAENVEISSLTSRVKTLPSVCEKISRKSYSKPFEELTDFSGVRIVYLYLSDLDKLEHLIEEEFEVVEKVNKTTGLDDDRFGYSAIHHIVKLKKKHMGARYDDLKDLACEIQIRTILQDAWAIVAHHLSYKSEADIPKELRRRLNALSGLFEIADDQFENLKTVRDKYKENLREELSNRAPLFLELKLNLDVLAAYVEWKFSDREPSERDDVAKLLEDLQNLGYKTLLDIDKDIERAIDAVLEMEKDNPPVDIHDEGSTKFVGVGLIRMVLSLIDEKYHTYKFLRPRSDKYKKYGALVKPIPKKKQKK